MSKIVSALMAITKTNLENKIDPVSLAKECCLQVDSDCSRSLNYEEFYAWFISYLGPWRKNISSNSWKNLAIAQPWYSFKLEILQIQSK